MIVIRNFCVIAFIVIILYQAINYIDDGIIKSINDVITLIWLSIDHDGRVLINFFVDGFEMLGITNNEAVRQRWHDEAAKHARLEAEFVQALSENTTLLTQFVRRTRLYGVVFRV